MFFRLLGFVILFIQLLIIDFVILILDYVNVYLQSFCCSNDLCKVTWRRYQYILLNTLFFSDLSSAKYTVLSVLVSCSPRSFKSVFLIILLKLKLCLVNKKISK